MISDEEEISVTLPVWPPEDSFSKDYPKLSRWKITVTGADFQYKFFTQDEVVKLQIKKNRPFCLSAQPLTVLNKNHECAYFKPAGFLYPWAAEESFTATWEQGFLANIMERFFLDAKENCMPYGDTAWLVSTFNWKKAQDIIEKKISESDQVFYNPWLIPTSPILENLSASQFKASLLNLTGCYAVSSDTISKNTQATLLSSFIPENSYQNQKKQFTVRKNVQSLIYCAQNYGILITFFSSKKISLEFINMPIYIEDI